MRRAVPAVLALLLALALLYLLLAAVARPRPPHPFFEGLEERPLVLAHQGGAGLWPSNTLLAFRNAWALGADVLELDLHLSLDGALVVLHDDTVDRTTDGSGPVAALTVAQLRELDAGYRFEAEDGSFPYRGEGVRVPILAEVFESLPDARFNLEIKPGGERGRRAAEALCALLRERGLEHRALVVSFHDEALAAFRERCPGVARAAGPGEVRLAWLLSRVGLGRLYRPRVEALQVPEASGSLRIVDAPLLATAARKNVAVHVWTIDDADDMRRLLSLGVDGLITDRPDRLQGLLDRAGERRRGAGAEGE